MNAYFPKSVKIAVGDSISFKINGFHNVNFGKARPISIGDTSKPVSGVNDAAGSPFWFNGQPRLILNPELMAPAGDGTVGGKGTDRSALPLDDGPPPPFKVKFTKTGSFTYLCDVHPRMRGKVTVVRKGKSVPSKAADARRADAQLAKALKTLKRSDAFKGPGGVNVRLGNDTRETSLYKFFPTSVTAKVGQTIQFQMSQNSAEQHSVTVVPDDYLKAQSDAFIAPDTSSTPPALVFNPVLFYPSDPQASFPAFRRSLHGNGFLNTGALDEEPKTPFPDRAGLAFGEAGTYTIYCAFHAPDMKATVTVTP